MKQPIAALPIVLFILTVVACGRMKEKTKEAVNKTGETAGKTATEFFEGVSEGVDKTLECEMSLSQGLKDKGLRTGKFTIGNDSIGSLNSLFTLYIIFDKDFKASISAMAFDKAGLEIGRVHLPIDRKAGDAGYFDFHFDARTDIEVRSKIVLE